LRWYLISYHWLPIKP